MTKQIFIGTIIAHNVRPQYDNVRVRGKSYELDPAANEILGYTGKTSQVNHYCKERGYTWLFVKTKNNKLIFTSTKNMKQ